MNEVEWRELRQRIVERDKNTCQYCGGTGHQVDFVIPTIHGGQASMDNLVCCCGTCLSTCGVRLFPSQAAKATYIASHRARTLKAPGPWWTIKPRPPAIPPRRNTTSRLRDRLKAKRACDKNHNLDICHEPVR